jgi:hypothetical protein
MRRKEREDAIQPWKLESEAALFRLTEDCRIPEEPAKQGLKYFLEVSTARELFDSSLRDASPEAQTERIIQYAINDA